MKIAEDFLDNPKRSIGGGIIPIIGVPGSGKTNVLIQLALMRQKDGHKILWRGTEQGEWLKFLANNVKVTVWNHKTIDRVRVKKSDPGETTYLELGEIPGVEEKKWEDPSKVVNESSKDRINVVNIPGVFGNGKEGRVFFTEKIIDVLEQIIRRENTYNFVDFFTDEAGDIWPCQQQLSGALYNLVANRTPPILSQLRKQNSFLYLAGHGTQDIHYFVWKIKANTICYMSNSKVKNFHTEVSQKKVNRLSRGEMIVPPVDRKEYALAYEEEDLDWVRNEHVDLVIEDCLSEFLEEEDEDDEDSVSPMDVKRELSVELWESEDLDLTQSEIGDMLGISQATVSNAIS